MLCVSFMKFGQFFIDLSTEFLTYNTNLSQNKPKSLSALTNNQYHPHYFKSGNKKYSCIFFE